MFNFTNAKLKEFIVHSLELESDGVTILSDTSESVISSKLEATLLHILLSSFRGHEYYEFFHESELALNELYSFSSAIFKRPQSFLSGTQKIARHLVASSQNANIKDGFLGIGFIKNILYESEMVDALVIIKFSKDSDFIQVIHKAKTFSIKSVEGISSKQIDKACVILNKPVYPAIQILDSSTSGHTQYWRDAFLKVQPSSNSYYQTKKFLKMTNAFVSAEENQLQKTEQIRILNNSLSYIKEVDQFDRKQYERQVLRSKDLIKSFSQFEQMNESEYGEIGDEFSVSKAAIRKFPQRQKSVIKLDKNFHIYVHGDSSLLEVGVDNDGRKYYKLFYEFER